MMMKVKFIAATLLTLTALFIAHPAWSHTKVKTSTLEDGNTA
ncbi:MAG: hypothetical protein ACPGVT_01075 [Maricaulaceae bacterium]